MTNQRAVEVNPYLQVPQSPIQYYQPDFDVMEKDKTPNWYIENVRFYSQYYNQKKDSLDPLSRVLEAGDANSGNLNSPILRGEADEMRLNFAYYFGRQPNIDFNFLTMDSTGKTFQNPWIRGKHAAKLIDFLKGPALRLLSSVKFSAQTLSKDVMSKKGQLIDKELMKFEMKEYMDKMKSMGATFAPTNNNFEMTEELQDWMRDYKDEGELLAMNFATDIYALNNLKYVYINAWLHTIVGGIGAVYNYVSNGKVKKKHIPCYHLIWDSRGDDNDFNEKGQYVGFIEFLTPQEIMSKWRNNLSKSQIGTIKALAEKQPGWEQFTNYFNGSGLNFAWYTWTANTFLVACVTMFWIGPRDLRWVKFKGRDGEKRVRKLNNYTQSDLENMSTTGEITFNDMQRMKPEADIRGDYETDDVHKAVLIGNCILAEYGYNKNRVGEWKNKGNPELPIKMFVPNMTAGEVRATMGLLRNNQDEIDRIAYTIRQKTAQSKGKVAAFRASKLQAPYNNPYALADIMNDIGVVVINDVDGIDPDSDKKPLADYLDLSGDAPMIQMYIKLKMEEERTMEEILNLSKVALGQNQGYISQGAQQNSAAYSSMGTAYLFDGFMQLVAIDSRYGANVQKSLTSMDGENETVQLIAGTTGVTWAKVTQERRFEDCLIIVSIADIIDEQKRERLIAYAQGWSQNPEFGVSPLDIIKLEKATTYSEMIRILELSLKKGEMKAQQQQAYQNMIDQVQQQQNAQAQMGQEQMRQQGADNRTQQQVKGKLAGDILKYDANVSSRQQQPQAQA